MITNALLETNTRNETVQGVFGNIEEWAGGIFETNKELFLLAVQKRSQFTFDLIYWIARISTLLLALSVATSCPEHLCNKLKQHALRLLFIFSWINDDEETIQFAENFQLTEKLFEMALTAEKRSCTKFASEAKKTLLKWGLKAGKYQNVLGTWETSLYALVVLALIKGNDSDITNLKDSLTEHLGGNEDIGQAARDHVAGEIMERAATLNRGGHSLSRLEVAMNQQNQDKLQKLLEDIAKLISPDVANELERTPNPLF